MRDGHGALRAVLLPAAAVCGALAVGALGLAQLAGGVVHVGEMALLCLRAPLALLDAAAHLGAMVSGGLAAVVVLTAIVVVVRYGARVRALSRSVYYARLAPPPPSVAVAAVAVGVAGRVDVVEAERPFAFVYGWLSPRICVSTGLAARFSAGELRAALLHERWHLMRRDPLRLAAAGAVRAGLWFVPVFESWVARYLVAVEVAADTFVVAEMGHPRWLAGALLQVDGSPSAPGFAGQLEPRVAALVGDKPRPPGLRARVAAALLAVEATIATLLVSESRLTSPLGFVLLHAC